MPPLADPPVLEAPTVRPAWHERAFRVVLYVFVGTMLFSVAGTLLLQLVPAAMGIFGPYYANLVKAPTWTYMGLLPILPLLAYAKTHRWPVLAFFALWGSLVGGMSELVGTTTGWPFGPYSYTAWLGPKILGHVPYFIPGSWFAMSLLSLDLASRLSARRWERIAMTAVFMLLWDVSLDPAMNHAFPFWNYPEGGFYYGMPASNWLGWLIVSAVIAWGYEVIGGGLRVHEPPRAAALHAQRRLSRRHRAPLRAHLRGRRGRAGAGAAPLGPGRAGRAPVPGRRPAAPARVMLLGRAPTVRVDLPEADRAVWADFRQHSRTFSLAARLLPREVRLPVATLYLFCRAVDTVADERPAAVGVPAAQAELDALEAALLRTLDGDPPGGRLLGPPRPCPCRLRPAAHAPARTHRRRPLGPRRARGA